MTDWKTRALKAEKQLKEAIEWAEALNAGNQELIKEIKELEKKVIE